MAVIGTTEMGNDGVATRRHRRAGAAALLGAVLLLAACGSSAATAPPPHATAAEACLAAAGSATDGGAWQVAVEADRADASALALVSRSDIAICRTGRTNDGAGFGNTTAGVDESPVVTPQVLTYGSAIATTDGSPSILVGRVPPGTSAVRLGFGDGSEQAASLGRTGEPSLGPGIWLAWLPTAAVPTSIEALDASGAVIARLADTSGVQPAGLSMHDG